MDQLGGLDRAIEVLKQRAHMSASERVTLVPYPGRRSVLDLLVSRAEPDGRGPDKGWKKYSVSSRYGAL